ncbi:unnamed protein product (macronuclear) [Paramecium tetraurelia]|uniref:Uncharacterized protein n=1 Tax=Paramecium tetraurelia TaxID=5888 RepID=A0DHK3_PARTE|nr:uncharacterized protein GSPATT00016907001 [Paramecium tetraurelia]CAK82520.1 unnamed protein product [Paramecium tetraurelia]|eukprot:XP_001449917.1 hypothetical protein (macronuclear) [Paramecium tetraurelia strain d4-2]
MSLNTSMPYYRNSSREVKTIKEIVQAEAIKSARLLSRDKVKVIQNTSFGDLNRSKRKVNNSFHDNRNNSQIASSNILSGYLANAFQEKKENIQRNQMPDITNKNKYDENKQREIKYLMRIAALEKESSKLTELATKLKKENQLLKQQNNQDLIIYQLQEALNISKNENQNLKKQITQLQNSNSNYFNNSVYRNQKNQSQNTNYTVNTTDNISQDNIKFQEYIPSYLVALSLAD